MSMPESSMVMIINSEAEAKRLVDPMRREILRLLSKTKMTENALARSLGLSAPSIGHHLNSLKSGGLVSVVRREEGRHGIIQKFYSASAHAYFIDREKMPVRINRYFMPMDLERARGALASLSLLKDNIPFPSSSSIERLADSIACCLVERAEAYKGGSSETDPEQIIHGLYREALKAVLKAYL